MNKLALTFLALPILLAGIGAADSKNSRINQALRVQKVCLTSIGWCSDYSKRTAESTSCYCRNHQQNPGRVTTMGVTLSTVPQID
jgi:hypothetical protein